MEIKRRGKGRRWHKLLIRVLFRGINFMHVEHAQSSSRIVFQLSFNNQKRDKAFILFLFLISLLFSQDGAGGGRGGFAGRDSCGQQVLVRGASGIPRKRGPAAFNAGETRGPSGPPLRSTTGDGRDAAARQ